jgi:hypothetical protein
MAITIHDLFGNPDYYLHAFEGEHAIFLRMDREAYHRSIFLDARIEPLDETRIRVPAEAIAAWRDDQRMPIASKGWIFHVANCGSTLLARALDRLQDDLVLREPMALRQLGVGHAAVPANVRPLWQARLRLAATQLGKRYHADMPVIVKANVPVNFILPELMALDPAAPSILLYYPLREYLLAILRSDAHRGWVMRVTGEMEPALRQRCGPLSSDPVERAAALWLGQMRAFADALANYPNAHSLDAAALFGSGGETVTAAAALFGVPLTDFQREAVFGSALFTTYSKNPGVRFNEADRRARQKELARSMAPDLARGRAWVDARLAAMPLPERLARPLAGEAALLLDAR